MVNLSVKKAELRVRQKRDTKGYLPIWQVIAVYMFSDGTVTRHVLCERDSYEKAMKIVERDYTRPTSGDSGSDAPVCPASGDSEGDAPVCPASGDSGSDAPVPPASGDSGSDAPVPPAAMTVEKAAELAASYDFQRLYDRWPLMSPVDVMTECKEVLAIYDALQQSPEPLALDGLSSGGFMDCMLFLETFCMRYLVDFFFNGQ